MKVAYWMVSSIFIFFSSVALGQGTDSSKLIPSNLVPIKKSFFQGSQTISFFPHIKQCISDTNIEPCPDGYSPKVVVSIKNIPGRENSGGAVWLVKEVRIPQEPSAQLTSKGGKSFYQIQFPGCGTLYPRTLLANTFQGDSEKPADLTAMIFCVPRT